jgi:pantothenate kinase
MKKIALLLLLISGLFAVDGEEVFKKNCTACHFGMITMAEFKPQFRAGNVKAPPMVEISNRLKQTITINAKNDNVEEIHRFTVIAFIKEYLKHPSWDYFACDMAAINRFKVMPAQTHLSEEESQAVAEWIYDYFEDKEFK